MSFELDNIAQSSKFFFEIKENMFEKINKASKNYSVIIRFSCLFISGASVILSLAERVAIIGEAVIKGLTNIFGSPFNEKCSFCRGLKQIFIQTPAHTLFLALFPIEGALRFLGTSLPMAICPEESSKSFADSYKKCLKIFEGHRIKKEEIEFAINDQVNDFLNKMYTALYK